MSESVSEEKYAIVRLTKENVAWLRSKIIAAIKASMNEDDADEWIELYVQVKKAEEYMV